jgi:AcrR family transcriptional regulator
LLARDRVLVEAARLFAERGFNKVTVREICTAAKANVASVNYHFGDKAGLYTEIVERGFGELDGGPRRPADTGESDASARLGAFVNETLHQMLAPAQSSHVQQLLIHEMADPTPMFDEIAKRVMRPRLSYLCKLVGELMGRPPADRQVVNAAASVQAQCLMAQVTTRTMAKTSSIDELADHITRFSLAGIRELGERRHDQQ